jgi:hypothetical protein
MPTFRQLAHAFPRDENADHSSVTEIVHASISLQRAYSNEWTLIRLLDDARRLGSRCSGRCEHLTVALSGTRTTQTSTRGINPMILGECLDGAHRGLPDLL